MAVAMMLIAIALFAGFKSKWDFGVFGKGALPSLLLAVVVVIGLFLSISVAHAEDRYETKWFDYTELFAGVDYTKKSSPSCDLGGVDDRLTSNLGVRQHIVTWKKVDVVGQYTHHSCAIGEDDRQYDALGAQLVYRWGGE